MTYFIRCFICFLVLCLKSSLFADCQMQHTLMFEVEPLNQMGQILGPSPFFYVSGKTGSSSSVINTYSIATNEINKKISAFLDNNMPIGTELTINMSPPSGARSMGTLPLSATPIDLVIEISKVSEEELSLVYTFTVTAKAGVISGATRVVFFTLTDG